jgi:hypothetical protein
VQVCFLCNDQSATVPQPHTFTYDVVCKNCGSFRIIAQAIQGLKDKAAIAFDLASWVCEQNQLGNTPTIGEETIEFIKNYPRPRTKKRVELYLGRAIRLLDNKLIGTIRATDPALRVASWSFAAEDAVSLANYLVELGAFGPASVGQDHLLQVKAHILYDEMVGQRTTTSQAFVAMWFDESMKQAYENGFRKAITAAGYEPLRIDRKEHDKKIDDQIIAEIRRSAFVVADFTEHRGGVYYEAGFAHGLGRDVIFTCQREHMDKLHFDVRQYNTIAWERAQDIVAPLQNRILALFGAGPIKPDARPIPP